jgi:hypothetical protein
MACFKVLTNNILVPGDKTHKKHPAQRPVPGPDSNEVPLYTNQEQWKYY